MSFPVGRSATLRRPNPGGIEWIQEVHVHRDMESCRIPRCNVERFLDDFCHAPLIQLAHRVDSDPESLNHLALARVDAAGPDNDCVLRQDLWREPSDAG